MGESCSHTDSVHHINLQLAALQHVGVLFGDIPRIDIFVPSAVVR